MSALTDTLAAFSSGNQYVALPGSRIAAPPGLEARIEFNGITLNTQNMIDRYRITKIEGMHSGPDIRVSSEANPSQDGEYPLKSYLGGRTVILTGRIMANNISKLRDMEQALRTAFYTRTEVPLIFRNPFGEDVYINARMVDKIAVADEQTSGANVHRDFQITMHSTSPRIYSANLYTTTLSGPANGLVTQKGNYYALPVIRINGPASNNLRVSSSSGGAFSLLTSVTIASGGWLQFDGVAGTLVDQAGTARPSYINAGSTAPVISNTSTITLTGTTIGSASLVVTYSDVWL